MNRPPERWGPADVAEHDLPGIGRSYDLRDNDGTPVSVVIHHTGRRDIYVGTGDVEPGVVLSFTDDQARRLGAILAGTDVSPDVDAPADG